MAEELIAKVNLTIGKTDDSSNLSIEVSPAGVSIQLKADKIFETLSNRKIIVGAINKELDQLVEQHLQTMAGRERVTNSQSK